MLKSSNLSIILLCLFMVSARAQLHNQPDVLANKLHWYGLKNSSPVLFIHYDKTVYSNNDDVWFTAYLLSATNIAAYNTLSVALIKDDDRSVIMDCRFKMKGGLVLGNMTIPNAAIPGNYSLVATTNRLKNGRSEVVFTQPVTIKSEETQDFTGLVNAIDTSLALPQQKMQVQVRFSNLKAGEAIPAVQLSYYLGSSVKPTISGYGETEAGTYDLSIPTKIIKQSGNVLHVQLWYKNDVKEISMALPASPQPALVAFYPEGGNIISGLRNQIGVEIKTANHDPLKTAATLFENEKPIGEFETSSYGLGRFTFTPKVNAKYAVKLHGAIKQDTAYTLPQPVMAGPVINIKHALAHDTLEVELQNTRAEKLFLQVHNFKKLLFSVPLSTALNKHLKIILDSVPKGLNQLTLTDSLGRPYAERVFFAHFNKRPMVEISTDQPTYGTRKKVTVKLKLKSAVADTALVSIACVQASRLELKKQNDIESYLYLKNDLEQLPVKEHYLGKEEADIQYLEAVLLIKGWRRYTWTDVLKITKSDTTIKYTDALIKGKVLQFDNKPLNKPVSLINLRYPLNAIHTTTQGVFELSNDNLLTDSGKKAGIMVTEHRPQLYTIRLNNPYALINERFAVQLQPKDYFFKGQESTQYMQLPDNEHTIRLKEVEVKGINDNGRAFNKRRADREGMVQFDVGQYTYDRNLDISTLVIHSYATTEPSSSYKLQLTGIYQKREFYPTDFSKNPSGQGFLSTLYWKHTALLLPGKQTELSFYTGDISGRFKIVVQGIAVSDVVFGDYGFTVAKSM